MKFLVVFGVVVCVAMVSAQMLSAEERTQAMQHKMDCMMESGVGKEVLKKAIHEGDFEDGGTLSKFFACLGKKVGFMNDDGELQVDTIKEIVTKFSGADIAEKVISECAMAAGSVEETALNFAKCSHQFIPKP